MESKLFLWAHSEIGRVGIIAKELDITKEYASMLVNSKHSITAKNAIKLSKLTGISIEDLISIEATGKSKRNAELSV